jgi:hypothetical protein
VLICPECRELNSPQANFCSACGARLAHDDARTTGSLATVHADTNSEDGLPRGAEAFLMLQGGQEAGSWFRIDRTVTTIGRHPESDIFLNDVTVSRRHAEILYTNAEFHLKDVGSLNGTYVDRERVDEAVLSPGTEIQIGKFRFLFLVKAARS